MAKRSDFAQKLLDDLRLRKERLAASSQVSNRSNTAVAADAYALAKREYRGSRELKTAETTSFRTGGTQSRSSGGNKSFANREAAKQIVPFGRGQRSEKIGDLSGALSFAIENGGKLTRMDSTGTTRMLAFLNQLGRGSMDYTKMERRNMIDRQRPSTSNFPTLSDVHIEEISRGAQKLNQILRACSNGLNFDKYSIEIGKELLKGAVDLEESLRMLVNLQEASEYMISPHRKSRITLLDDEEDEEIDDNTVRIAWQRQLDRPSFSFDKRSKNYHDIEEVARNDINLRLATLTFPPEATNFIYEKQSVTHKRSASTSSQSKEKARIPNVIAKLMGLGELPVNKDSNYTTQKDSSSKQKVQEKKLKKTVQETNKNAKKRTDNTENLAPPTSKQKTTQTNKIPAVHNIVELQAERELAVCNASFKAVIHDGKLPWKESENIKSATGSKTASFKVDKLQGNTNQVNGNIGRLKVIQEKHREQRGAEKSKMNEPVLKDGLQRMVPPTHKRSEAAVISSTENIYTDKLLHVSHYKSQNSIGLQQPQKLRNIEPMEEKHQVVEKAQQYAKQKMPISKQKGSEPIFTALSKPKRQEIDLEKKHSHRNQAAASKKSLTEDVDIVRYKRIPVGRHHEDIASDRKTTNINDDIKASVSTNTNDTSPRDLESNLAKPKKAFMPPPMEQKPVHEADTGKAESINLPKRELPRKINEVMIKRGGNLQNSGKSPKHQHSILLEMKQRSDKLSVPVEANHIRIRKSEETEASLIKFNASVACIQLLTAAEQLQKKDERDPNLYSPVEEERLSLKAPQILSLDDSSPQVIPTLMNDKQSEQPAFDDEQRQPHITESNSTDGAHEAITDVSYTSQLKCLKVSKSETPVLLTESENHLKQILIKSQIFLHTAEALFKLSIPYGILHAGGLDCQDEHSKFVLDCSYEVMKRKGRIQELSIHPFIKVSITATKVRSLDELVKELHKDIDKLRLYGRNGKAEVVIEDYLPKMLECDVYNKDPYVNCMWDFSWNEMMFAFIEKDDVIMDVERSILNGLVDEITRDLY